MNYTRRLMAGNLEALPSELVLLTIIVNQHQASKVQEAIQNFSAIHSTCLLGKGIASSGFLRFLEMDDIHKEIVKVIVPSQQIDGLIDHLNHIFKFNQPNHGILFVSPLSDVGNWQMATETINQLNQPTAYTAVITILDKGKGKEAVELANKQGVLGGTIVEAHGSANKSLVVLDIDTEPLKEMVFFVVPHAQANELISSLLSKLTIRETNSGIIYTFPVTRTEGLLKTGEDIATTPLPEAPKTSINHYAVYASVNKGDDEIVIQASQRAGARGGTIIHTRSTTRVRKTHYLAHLQREREMVIMVVDAAIKDDVIQAIHHAFSEEEDSFTHVFAVPVISTYGLL